MLQLGWVDSAQEPRWLSQAQDSCCGLSAQPNSAAPWSFESKRGNKIWKSNLFSTKTQQKHLLKTYLTQLMFVRLAVSACQNIHVYVFSFLIYHSAFLLCTSVGGVECKELECGSRIWHLRSPNDWLCDLCGHLHKTPRSHLKLHT